MLGGYSAGLYTWFLNRTQSIVSRSAYASKIPASIRLAATVQRRGVPGSPAGLFCVSIAAYPIRIISFSIVRSVFMAGGLQC